MESVESSTASVSDSKASKPHPCGLRSVLSLFAHLPARLLWGLLLLLAAFGVAAMVAEYLPPRGPPLRLEVREVPGIANPKLVEHRYSIILHNTTGDEVRVVGANTICGPRGCIEAAPLPLVIPPFGESDLTVRHTASKDVLKEDILNIAVQDAVLELYVDCHTGSTLTIPVTLTASAGSGR
jgi:hypothetical protein